MLINYIKTKKPAEKRAICGAAGSRTPVQTPQQYAFYMLILLLIFVLREETDIRAQPYLFESSSEARSIPPTILEFTAPPYQTPRG